MTEHWEGKYYLAMFMKEKRPYRMFQLCVAELAPVTISGFFV